MSQIEKLRKKFYSKPIPNDMRIEDIKVLAKSYGCITEAGGKHPLKIIHPPTGTVIPIPKHGDTVAEVYIKQLKILFDSIGTEEEQ